MSKEEPADPCDAEFASLATAIDHYREHAPEIRQWREREGI